MAKAAQGTFSATGPLLGYLYQCRWALLLLLQKTRTIPNTQVSVERFDDVAFEDQGNPLEAIQTEHHTGAPRSLSDASVDLWKTLRVWSEGTAPASSWCRAPASPSSAPS